MSYIIDRLILLALCTLLLTMQCTISELLVLLLLGICIAGVCYFFENPILTGAIGIAYLGLSIYFPSALCILPVVVYELYKDKCQIVMIALGLIYILLAYKLTVVVGFWIVLLGVLACVLYTKTEKSEQLDHMVKVVRDDSEERNLLLAEKNKHLIEKQDSEVYVATLKERNRIAREIHDNVGHILTRTILQMGALMTIHKEEPLHGQLTSVKENLDIAMNNVRESVHDLHDESVDLRQAIEEIADTLRAKFVCNLDYDISGKVERSCKYAMIGIIKEAVSNVLKHSHNDTVDIVLREHPGMYQILVHDYSENQQVNTRKKTIEERTASGGIGMQNMSDRVIALHGNMTVTTENGFRIFISIPK